MADNADSTTDPTVTEAPAAGSKRRRKAEASVAEVAEDVIVDDEKAVVEHESQPVFADTLVFLANDAKATWVLADSLERAHSLFTEYAGSPGAEVDEEVPKPAAGDRVLVEETSDNVRRLLLSPWQYVERKVAI